MTSFDRFERSLPALLDDLAVPRLPDYADDLFARTAASRQRPGWSFPERWLPMSAVSRRLAAVPRIPWRLGVLVALLAIAALVGVLVAGSLLNPRPAPYGPAANGNILFVDDAGAIVAGDPATGITTTLVGDPGGLNPIYSQDGTRMAFTRANGSVTDLWVAGADGSGPRQVSTTSFYGPSFVGWSGSGDRLLVVDVLGRMLLFDAAQSGPPTILNDLLKVGPAEVGPGYNVHSTHGFRPPRGDEIVFVETTSQTLMTANADGTGLRVLLDQATTSVPYTGVNGADWSPDGSKLLVMLELPDRQYQMQLFVLNPDGTGLRRLGNDPLDQYNSPKWSPDGNRIAFQYWTAHTADEGQDYHGIGVLDLASGDLRDLGPVQANGFTSWDWSPDGLSILQVPGDGSGDMNIVNVETGDWDTLPWKVDAPITWQRRAP